MNSLPDPSPFAKHKQMSYFRFKKLRMKLHYRNDDAHLSQCIFSPKTIEHANGVAK